MKNFTTIAAFALTSALSTASFAQDVEINGSLVLQAASVQNQITLANDNSEAFTRINSIQDSEINGSLVLQAASVQNQITLANDDSCAETTINQIGRSRGC
ncbi:MAG: hypothetical protein R3F53_12015 [Gammaproteobacteria bacterium]